MQGRTARALLRAWSAWAGGCSRRVDIRTTAVTRLRSRLLSAAFAGWAQRAPRAAALRSKATAVVLRWRDRSLTAAFGRWADHARLAGTHRHVIAAAVARIKSQKLAAAFASWAEYAPERALQRRKVQRALAALRSRAAAAAFRSWADFAPRSAQNKAVLAAAVGRLRSAAAAAALAGWVGFAARKAARKEATVVARCFRTQRLLGCTFADWLRNASEDAYERRVISQSFLDFLVFFTLTFSVLWATWARYIRQDMYTVIAFQSFLQSTCSIQCKQHMIVDFCMLHMLGTARQQDSTGILARGYERCGCAQVLQMCVHRLQSGCVCRAFDGWLSRVETKAAAREKMQLVRVALMDGTKVASSFTLQNAQEIVLWLPFTHAANARVVKLSCRSAAGTTGAIVQRAIKIV